MIIEDKKIINEFINKMPKRDTLNMETFVSIVVPYFNRISYLKELIESAHKYADMPFQLLVHDDVSVDGSTPEVFNLRNKISTLIINSGHNVGLPSAVNRLVNLATSEYIIFLNCDCAFTSNCFKDIVNILSKPYIGFIHVVNTINPDMPLENTKFSLVGLQSGSALAFRKSVWKEVGGWSENVHSGASDVAFVQSIFSKGYFGAAPYGKRYASNLSYDRVQNKDSSMGMSGYDCSYPKIFNLQYDYDRYCKIREADCNQYANSLINVPGSITNMGYWCEYMNNVLYSKSGNNATDKIDWEAAKLHNHDKWKDEIMKETCII